MFDQYKLLIIVLCTLAVAFGISFAATPLVRLFAKKIGAMDVPKDDRRMHNVPIPRIGGLAIFFGFIVSVLIFADINTQLRGILIGLVIIVVLGLVDDIMPLPALLKLVVQIIAALVAVTHGTVINHLTNPNIFSPVPYWTLGAFAAPVTVIWIVAITNSVNFIDGLDGLAVGVSAISAFSMLIIALMVSEPNVAVVVAALAGGCVGFMPYNLNPAKIFMGDVGATAIGFILATMSIQGLFKFYAIVSFAVPFLILALPLFDFIFAFFRRILAGKSPMSADRGHVHHRLIDMGFNQKQVVAIMYTMSGLLGVTAVVLTARGELRAMILLVAFLVAGLIAARLLITGNSGKERRSAAAERGTDTDSDTDSENGEN
ncbi:MAG: undecaprenyl/decaprenyl-phosphate alpha-N-acetylglucosaminyl 1-phosphate transferase [Oscillospiraceae bacterium]|jgi:UDP-GlcNAc:undecaprenyl-phosphate GlcNAc-1-phosphate transferase|nr:undecaprenyl/decaprenyl-phosphate alpha-N-acetylglucosaminyl 1-phosphate transferase [Oscillospiraceae bacterium]